MWPGPDGGTHKRFVTARSALRMAVPPSPDPVTAVAVGGGGLLVAGFLVRLGPVADRRTVLATLPWMLLGGTLHAFARAGAYDGPLAATLGSALVVPAMVLLGGVPWLVLLQAGRLRTRSDPAGYLGAVGIGVLVPVLAAVLLFGRSTVGTLVPVMVTPVVAALVAAAVLLVLVLSAAPALAATRSLGLLVVYAQAFHAVAVAVAVDALGATVGGPLADVAVDLGTEVAVGGVGTAWPFVPVKLAGAALVVVVAGRLAERRPTAAYLSLGVVAALGIGPAVATLLSATVLS